MSCQVAMPRPGPLPKPRIAKSNTASAGASSVILRCQPTWAARSPLPSTAPAPAITRQQTSQRSGQSKKSGGAVDKPTAGGANQAAAGGGKKAAAPAKRKKAAQAAAGNEGEEQDGEGGEQQQEQQPEAGKGPKFGSVKVRGDEPGAPQS